MELERNELESNGICLFDGSNASYIIDNFSSFDFEEEASTHWQYYMEDIEKEEDYKGVYANRLIQELVENNILSDDDLFKNEDNLLDYDGDLETAKDKYNQDYVSSFGSSGDYFEEVFGKRWTDEVSFLNNYIKWNKVAEWVIETDGRAFILASYDGKEYEEEVDGTVFYIYQIN